MFGVWTHQYQAETGGRDGSSKGKRCEVWQTAGGTPTQLLWGALAVEGEEHLFHYLLFSGGMYSNRSEIEQFRVWQILINTSVSRRVIVLFMYPFSWECWISAFWQNLFWLIPDAFNKSERCIFNIPLFSKINSPYWIKLKIK